MAPLIYKTICRLDYPVSFDLLDRLGHHAQVLHSNTLVMPFASAVSNVDMVAHSCVNTGTISGDPYRVSLSPTTMDALVEFRHGIPLDELAENKVTALLDTVLDGLHQNLQHYERVGVRSFILVKRSEFTFDTLSKTLFDLNSDLTKAFNPVAKLQDIGVIFEGTDHDGRRLRAALGPYQLSERAKYFNNGFPEVPEALILDIDTWIQKVEIPKFTLQKFARRHQQILTKLTANVVDRVLARLNGVSGAH